MSVNEVSPAYLTKTIEIQLQQQFSTAANKTVSLSPVVVPSASAENVMVPQLKSGTTRISDVRNDEFLQKLNSIHVKLFSPSSELLAQLVAVVSSLIATGALLVTKMSECNEKQARVAFTHRSTSAMASTCQHVFSAALPMITGGLGIFCMHKNIRLTNEITESLRAPDKVLNEFNIQHDPRYPTAQKSAAWGHLFQSLSPAASTLSAAGFTAWTQIQEADAGMSEKYYQSGTATLEHASRQSEDIKALLQHMLQIMSQTNARTNDACGNFRA